MAAVPVSYQKSTSQQKVTKVKSNSSVLKEIRRSRRSNLMYVNKLPYKHLIKEFSKDMHEICENNNEQSVNVVNEASQAYLSGLFEDYTVCQSVADKKSKSFLICLASLGLKNLYYAIANNKNLANSAKKSELNYNYLRHSDNHDHDDDQDIYQFVEHSHHQHNANYHEQMHENNHHNIGRHHPTSQNINLRSDQERVQNVISHIRRRISSNVTVSVLRD